MDIEDKKHPIITFLVPVYNERNTILSVLERLDRFADHHETIVVDDGSTDGTRDILKNLNRPGIQILYHERNAGKGASIRTGLEHAQGTYVAIQDADLEYDPLQYASLLYKANQENSPVVFGSRFLKTNPAIYNRFLWGNKIITAWINLCGHLHLTDSYTCFKLIRRDLFLDLRLTSRGFEMETEICMKLARRGVSISEVPISYTPRRIDEGKKIGWKDAFKGAWTALKIRLSPMANDTWNKIMAG
jgi:dolichol-phosphate mannosyltransferase